MSWVSVKDWKPPFGLYVEIYDEIHGERHIARLCEETKDIFDKYPVYEIWRDRFNNVVWPQYWAILRSIPTITED